MPIDLKCTYCFKKYSVKPSKSIRSKFCSRYCHAKKTIAIEKKETKACIECGNNFTHRHSISKIRSFCSVKCAKTNWGRSYNKEGKDHSRYTNGSGLYRKLALNYYENICKKCGTAESLEVHHIDKNRKNNEMQNLALLCGPCHHLEHTTYTKSKCKVCDNIVKRYNNKFCSRACLYASHAILK